MNLREKYGLARAGYPPTETGRTLMETDRLKNELRRLEAWFAGYDRITVEHGRCARLGTPCAHDMAALDAEAEKTKARINEIRSSLGGGI